MQSPLRAPEYQIYRFLTVADSVFNLPATGVCGRNYKWLNFSVVPVNVAARPKEDDFSAVVAATTTNPSIRVRYWQPLLKVWVKANPDVVLAGLGAGVAYEFSVQNNGRDVMIEMTSGVTASEGVVISVSAFPEQEAI